MKRQTPLLLLAASVPLCLSSCKDPSQGGGAGGAAGGEPLDINYPPAVVGGTEKPVKGVPNLVPVPEAPPRFNVPKGTVLLSKGAKVTGSDENPLIGSLELITDGDKQCDEGYFVELLDGSQWVQIDLGKSAAVHAVCVWHFFQGAKPPAYGRAYHDVVIRVSDDPEFKEGAFATLYNNDYDDSSKLGKGGDSPYAESRFGLIADGKGATGRYVRLYSAGNTANEMNHYTEVEVYGVPR